MQQPPLQIINGCKKNDRRAQQELFRHCYPFLMNVCTRYRKNEQEARAVLNEGFLKILTKISIYDSKIPFALWARKIVVNTMIDDFRKNKKWKVMIVSKDFSEDYQVENGVTFNSADLDLDASYLLRLVEALPPAANKVFNLFAIDGFSHREISEMLNISEGTSKWHMSDARKRLIQMIKKNENSLNKNEIRVPGGTSLYKKITS